MFLNTSSSRFGCIQGGGASTLRYIGRRPIHRTVIRSTDSDEDSTGPPIDEETLSRLQKAEEEAAQLRQEIASLRSSAPRSKEEALSRAGRTFWSSAPFDSKDLKRETIFESNNQTGNWLSEADVDFIMGENGLSPKDQETVNRRLAIGGVISIVCLVFAFIPTERFQLLKPKGRVTDYLVPVLRTQDLLKDAQPVIEEADWDALRLVIDRIINAPNKLKSNLESSIAFLKEEDLRRRGRGLSGEILEFVQEMDYNKYFEDRLNTKRFRGGDEEAQFVEFSMKAAQTAMIRLDQFLNLFPKSEIEVARNVITSVYD